MSLQNKPQMVEAVLFFNERGICKEMHYPEFEALLDNVVQMHDFADQQVRCAYVLINPRLLVRSVVLFLLDFDERGEADKGWNIPLRHLAERAGRGPDLGAGPIRLACRSQCPVSWHQMHLWDPNLSSAGNDLALIRDAVKRNNLGILVEEEMPQPVELDRLQMVSEDRWYAPASASQEEIEKRAAELEEQHRQKTAQLIQQERLRIATLSQQHEEELAKFRLVAEQQLATLKQQAQALQQQLKQQEELNASLKAQLAAQADAFAASREEISQQQRELEKLGKNQIDLLRAQFDSELSAKIAAAVVEHQEQVALRDVELAYRKEQETQLREEIARLHEQLEQARGQGDGQVLEQLSKLGVVFVVYHPGAGHLTIALQDIARYQENPMAYVAAKCFVSEPQYCQWLAHYQMPSCEALLPSGERCGMPIDRVDTPSRFISGDSNCCARHKASSKLRTVS